MLPLTLAETGTEQIIRKVGGSQEVRMHLENLGFVAGGSVTVVAQAAGNLIVNVKETRIALDRTLASKIMV